MLSTQSKNIETTKSKKIAPKLHIPKIESTDRWIRVQVEKQFIADSQKALLLIDHGRGKLTTYFFPQENVNFDFLKESEFKGRGDIFKYWNVKIGNRFIKNAAYSYNTNVPEEYKPLQGYITFKWNLMDKWLEEDEEIIGHARDPYHRVDAVASSRHIVVKINGEKVADTKRPVLVFETGIRTRYYIPVEDFNTDLLTQTNLSTICPYKGTASYWSVKLNSEDNEYIENIVWGYKSPFGEVSKIKDLLSFYNEKVQIFIDGAREKFV